MPKGWKPTYPLRVSEKKDDSFAETRALGSEKDDNSDKKWLIDQIRHNIEFAFDTNELYRRTILDVVTAIRTSGSAASRNVLAGVGFIATFAVGAAATTDFMRFPLAEILAIDFIAGIIIYSYLTFIYSRVNKNFSKLLVGYAQLSMRINGVKSAFGKFTLNIDDFGKEELLHLEIYTTLVFLGRFQLREVCSGLLSSPSMAYYRKYLSAELLGNEMAIFAGLQIYKNEFESLNNDEFITTIDKSISLIQGMATSVITPGVPSTKPLLELYEIERTNKNIK